MSDKTQLQVVEAADDDHWRGVMTDVARQFVATSESLCTTVDDLRQSVADLTEQNRTLNAMLDRLLRRFGGIDERLAMTEEEPT